MDREVHIALRRKPRAMPKIPKETTPILQQLLRDKTRDELEMPERTYYRWRGGTIPKEVAFLLNRSDLATAVAHEAARLKSLGIRVPEAGEEDAS